MTSLTLSGDRGGLHLSLAWFYQEQKSSNLFSPDQRGMKRVFSCNPCYCAVMCFFIILPGYFRIHCSCGWRPVRSIHCESLSMVILCSCISFFCRGLHSINWHQVYPEFMKFTIWSCYKYYLSDVGVQHCLFTLNSSHIK